MEGNITEFDLEQFLEELTASCAKNVLEKYGKY